MEVALAVIAVIAALGIVGTIFFKARFNSAREDYDALMNRCNEDTAQLQRELDELKEDTPARDKRSGKFVKRK